MTLGATTEFITLAANSVLCPEWTCVSSWGWLILDKKKSLFPKVSHRSCLGLYDRRLLRFFLGLTQQNVVEPFSTPPFYSCFQVICLQPKKDGDILTSPSVHTGAWLIFLAVFRLPNRLASEHLNLCWTFWLFRFSLNHSPCLFLRHK